MFDVLREQFSKLFSRFWLSAEGRITSVYIEPYQTLTISVTYEFSIPNDGKYEGQSFPPG